MPFYVALLILCSVNASSVFASEIREPLGASELTPFAQIYPSNSMPGWASQWRILVDYELANTQIYETRSGESLALDLEYEQRSVSFERRFADTWLLSFRIARGAYGGGSTDGFIERWHDTFGLPNGSRDDFPQDRIALKYARNGVSSFDITRSQSGMLDSQVQISKQVSQSQSLSVWATLPTGDDSNWLGANGSSIGLAWSYRSDIGDRASWFASVGGQSLSSVRARGVPTKDAAARFSAGAAWSVGPNLALKLQVHGHTAFYDSNLGPLGDDALILVMGGSVRLTDDWLLNLSVTEDIAVDASPDVGLHLGLAWRSR